MSKLNDDLNQILKDKLNFRMDNGKKAILIVFGVILVIWLLTGIYIVAPDEQGVVLRFGKYNRTTKSGPHFRIPYPFEQVFTPKVSEIRRIELGFRMIHPGPPARYRDVPEEAFMLTGDENIVGLDFIVQYKIKNANHYLFKVNDIPGTIRDVAEAAMRAVIGKHKIDEALTSGKFMIQEETKTIIQEIVDIYEMGVTVITVQLQDVQPPDEVVAAFKEVASAREDRSKLINEAQGYRNDIIPKARGEAEKELQLAEGYKQKRIKDAEGDIARFNQILKEYKKSPAVTRKRLYIEAMQEILPRMKKYVVQSDGKSNLINLLQLQNNQGGQK